MNELDLAAVNPVHGSPLAYLPSDITSKLSVVCYFDEDLEEYLLKISKPWDEQTVTTVKATDTVPGTDIMYKDVYSHEHSLCVDAGNRQWPEEDLLRNQSWVTNTEVYVLSRVNIHTIQQLADSVNSSLYLPEINLNRLQVRAYQEADRRGKSIILSEYDEREKKREKEVKELKEQLNSVMDQLKKNGAVDVKASKATSK